MAATIDKSEQGVGGEGGEVAQSEKGGTKGASRFRQAASPSPASSRRRQPGLAGVWRAGEGAVLPLFSALATSGGSWLLPTSPPRLPLPPYKPGTRPAPALFAVEPLGGAAAQPVLLTELFPSRFSRCRRRRSARAGQAAQRCAVLRPPRPAEEPMPARRRRRLSAGGFTSELCCCCCCCCFF